MVTRVILMEIITAKTAGFCFGVRRALSIAEETAGTNDAGVYTYGPLIHNDEVVRSLKEKGIEVLGEPGDHAPAEGATVIIRSHGVSRDVTEDLERKGMRVTDATCPFVLNIHKIVRSRGEEGCEILIIGDPGHPEVRGIRGWCVSPVSILQTEEEARNWQPLTDNEICVVSQTTFNEKKFCELVEIVKKKGYHINVFNTICSATKERQEEARKIASQVDVMLVIGDRKSSNTQKLYDICKKTCVNTYYIQTVREVEYAWFLHAKSVGITAGASTPNNIIEEVQIHVRAHI